MKRLLIWLAFAAAILTTTGAEAKHRHRHVAKPKVECTLFCWPSERGTRIANHMGFGAPVMKPIVMQPLLPTIAAPAPPARKIVSRRAHKEVSNFGAPTPNVTYTVQHMLPHPDGCPHRAFCGCGAALEVFGRNVRSLWLASNWFSFPRTEPAPGMVMVRRHHVAVLRQHVQGSVWMVADYNGGRHQSWLHARSISGYAIVNPYAGGKHAQRLE